MTSDNAGSSTITAIAASGSESGSESEPGRAASVQALEHYLAALQGGRRPSREAFLAEHPDLTDELARCLEVLEFIQSAADGVRSGRESSPSDDALPADTMLGDYRLIREAGRGGMGIVYEAEQVPLARRVALKVLPFAASLDAKLVQRFRIEAQVAAQLNHPHIVPVYAVGSERGFHYFAMRFIEGQSLAGVIRERQGVKGPGDEPPSAPRARVFARAIASIGLQAAEALEHAHSLGVLHRDIKPGNLLLDETGSLWVADFGLARLRDDPGPTQSGDLLGTLRYMSPEQLLARRGVVDQRSDVYSLGATLYEALTLRPAFDGQDHQTLIQQVLFDDPTPPRRINPTIPKALETVILKAMTKEPSGRYATSAEFADDLRRFLDDVPVLARPQSVVDRSVKWARRHRTSLMAAATALVLALTVASALLWHERNQTVAALDEARRTLDREARAMDLISEGAYSLSMIGMASMTQEASQAQQQLAQSFLQQALSFYGMVSRIPGDDLRRRETKAKAWFGLGLTRWLLKQPESEEAYRRSVALYDELLAEAPNPQLRIQQLASLKYLALVINEKRGLGEAEPLFLDLLKKERALIASAPSDPSMRIYLTTDLTTWGEILKAVGRTEEAERAFQEAKGATATKID
jgi:serine/threonine protein kinase